MLWKVEGGARAPCAPRFRRPWDFGPEALQLCFIPSTDQALYSYASEAVFDTVPKPVEKSRGRNCYETPDSSSVRGLMLGLNNQNSVYETPDASSVNAFMSRPGLDAADGGDDYEMPDQETVQRFAKSLDRRQALQG